MIALVKLNWVDLGTKLEVRQCHGHLVETYFSHLCIICPSGYSWCRKKSSQ